MSGMESFKEKLEMDFGSNQKDTRNDVSSTIKMKSRDNPNIKVEESEM